MIEMLARKSAGGDVYLNLARAYLENCEWGRARSAIEEALEKGGLTDAAEALRLRREVDVLLGYGTTGGGGPAEDR